MTDQELIERVAGLLGWTKVNTDDPVGDFPARVTGWNPEEGVRQIIPRFTISVDACEAIWRDERVIDWDVYLGGVELRNKDSVSFGIHDGTAVSIARAICEAFLELCEKEKGK